MIASPVASTDRHDQETYRCTAPYGHSDGSTFPTASDDVTVSGKISLHTADIGPKWNSVAQILLHQHNAQYSDGDCGCNGIALLAYKDLDRVEFHLKVNGENVPIARSPYETPISFSLSINSKGVMTVSIGKSHPEIKTVILRHPEHNMLELTCSGVDVSFLEVTIS